MKVALAQVNLTVGDVAGNTEQVLKAAALARDEFGASLIAFPELTLTGYPPEDLLFHRGLRQQVRDALDTLCTELTGIVAVVGFPEYAGPHDIYNAAAVIRDGRVDRVYRKQVLPNYGVFDEKRYFVPGDRPCVFTVDGIAVGLTVCEDAWQPEPAAQARAAGAAVLLNINASPFEIDKQDEREHILCSRVAENGLPMLYVNLVGGQDELVFDGGSCAMDASGTVTTRAPAFDEAMPVIELKSDTAAPRPGEVAEPLALEPSVYSALTLGVRDYVVKHGFPGVVVGLSGGIDSAVTLAVAADALGADRVRAVLMPSRY
ncbi:MAG: nitrilase-related carbon-nitrogen hydrolase, partial [Pseudomonadota bacterium]